MPLTLMIIPHALQELQEHPCDRGNDTATANLLSRPTLSHYAAYLASNFKPGADSSGLAELLIEDPPMTLGQSPDGPGGAHDGGQSQPWRDELSAAVHRGDTAQTQEWILNLPLTLT